MVGFPASLGISSDSIALKICLNFSLCLKPDDYYKSRDAVNQLVNDKFTSALLF
ncbi:hypothetical protein AB3S75_033838 [Citrus x aurantiifolia]